MPLLRYLLNELLDTDGDGVPDQQQGVRRGVPRTPGMALGAPSSDQRTDSYLGIDAPEPDSAGDPEFEASPLEQFLERFSQGGMPQGLQQPRGLLQGLVSGAAQGAVGRGQRVGERRKKFEATQAVRAAERDKANLAATQKYRDQRTEGKAGLAKEGRDEARKQREYERTVADRIPGEKIAADRETRRQFETDRTHNLSLRTEGRQAAKDAADAAKDRTKPPTVAQERAQLFYSRAKEATVNATDGGLEGRMLNKAWSLAQPPALQGDPDTRKYWRAMEGFSLALNRLESGAAIAPTEFAKVRQLYFVAPGDKAADVKAKEKMRATIIESLWRMQSPDVKAEQAAADGGATITPAQLWEP